MPGRFKVAAHMSVVECVCVCVLFFYIIFIFKFCKASKFFPESIVTLFDGDSTGPGSSN